MLMSGNFQGDQALSIVDMVPTFFGQVTGHTYTNVLTLEKLGGGSSLSSGFRGLYWFRFLHILLVF
jgi:hypothetical protein